MAQSSPLNIVLGRGALFFDRFLPGTMTGEGERYIGNTTAFSIRRDIQIVERLRSIRGRIVKRDELPTRELLQGAFTTDEISSENVSAWFGGGEIIIGQEPVSETIETFQVKVGRFYQLGRAHSPIGLRNVDFVTFSIGGVVIDQAPNIQLDKSEGRFQIIPGAPDVEDLAELSVAYQTRSAPTAIRFSNEAHSLEGSLRFIATNPIGPKKNYFFPRVSITSDGQASLKGDEWQQLTFSFESVPLNSGTAQMYISESAPGIYTSDELAIIEDAGLTLETFPYWEDQLDEIINGIMPYRGY